MRLIKKTVTWLIESVLYTWLSERQRRFIAGSLSDSQKKWIKKVIKGKKTEQRRRLQDIKFHLYNLGFTEKALADLESFYHTVKNPNIKRLAAWELLLWHANQYTEEGYRKALQYLDAAKEKEKNPDQLRRLAVLKAECLEALKEEEKAKVSIDELLNHQNHPDLYLAAANLEKTPEARVKWLNKVMDFYQLLPVSFISSNREVSYDDLQVASPVKKVENEAKVTVILPAFKAEEGISTAMDSILGQTWQNLELIVVDDCSPDGTVEVVKEYIEADSRVKLFSTPVNSGPYVARNIALQHATGEFITINDSDDWSHPQKLEIQVRHLLENAQVIANTSEHARLTEEELKFYRRGMPGRYIFPNMSSIMFRKQPVLERLGFWDSVRFAADGEFKRRLVKEFGASSYVDLKSGPLSLPRQTVVSLTGSSAFGYNGFFMGVRREYVESMEFYHARAENLLYPYPMEKRLFPVPEPMWPVREEKKEGYRQFSNVIAADFRIADPLVLKEIKHAIQSVGRVGLIQLNRYDYSLEQEISPIYRALFDEVHMQLLVYGEKINTQFLTVIDPAVLGEWQKYIPEVKAETIQVIINQLPENREAVSYNFDKARANLIGYFGKAGHWYPLDSKVRNMLGNLAEKETKHPVEEQNWVRN